MYLFKLIGALTIKPYSFKARPWEYTSLNSIDFFDSMASNTKIEIRGRQVLRVLPRQNDQINETWITDRARFGLDSLNIQRIGSFIKSNVKSLMTLPNFIQYIGLELLLFFFLKKHEKIFNRNIIGYVDSLISSETLIFFKDFLTNLGSSHMWSSLSMSYNFSKNLDRSLYIFRDNLSLLNSELCFFVGFNPRLENPIFNLKIRKHFLKNNIQIFSFTPINNPNFDIQFLGNSINAFLRFCEGRHMFVSSLFNYKSSIFLLGNSIMYRRDVFIFFSLLTKLLNYIPKSSFYFVYNKLNDILISEYGFLPSKFSKHLNNSSNLIFNLSSVNLEPKHSKESFDYNKYVEWAKRDINIFLGTFGFNGLKFYDYVFPLTNILEVGGTFLSLAGVKSNVPLASVPFRNTFDFYVFYTMLFRYLNHFNFSRLSNITSSKLARLNQLGVFDPIFSKNFSIIPMFYLYGSLNKNLINVLHVNSFIINEYTLNSPSLYKAKKLYSNFFSTSYF